MAPYLCLSKSEPVGANKWGPPCILLVNVSAGILKPTAAISATVKQPLIIILPHDSILYDHCGTSFGVNLGGLKLESKLFVLLIFCFLSWIVNRPKESPLGILKIFTNGLHMELVVGSRLRSPLYIISQHSNEFWLSLQILEWHQLNTNNWGRYLQPVLYIQVLPFHCYRTWLI